MIKDLVLKNRAYRRFYQEVAIERDTLVDLVDVARVSSCGGNIQSLKYVISFTKERNQLIFDNLKWAGYLTDWDGPVEGERPTGYIIILRDNNISKNCFCDHGIASANILNAAVEKGLGGCIFASINRPEIMKALAIPENNEILLVIALGKPKENVILKELEEDGDIKYYRDAEGNHFVPKRKLEQVLLDI